MAAEGAQRPRRPGANYTSQARCRSLYLGWSLWIKESSARSSRRLRHPPQTNRWFLFLLIKMGESAVAVGPSSQFPLHLGTTPARPTWLTAASERFAVGPWVSLRVGNPPRRTIRF